MKRARQQSRQATESTALRTVLAIVGAYALNAALVLLVEAWLARISRGTTYYATDLGLQCLIEMAAGFLCCIVARRGRKQVVMALVIGLGLIVGTFSLVLSWNAEPHWYAASLLGVWAPCVWLGYRLGLRVDPAGRSSK